MRRSSRPAWVSSTLAVLAVGGTALAQPAGAGAGTPAPAPPPGPAPAPAQPAPALPTAVETPVGKFSIGGYVEAEYSYSFEKPSNGIIDERGFDNRHNTFTVSNAVVDVGGKFGSLSARIALQVGRTPDTYYLSEPTSPGTASTLPDARRARGSTSSRRTRGGRRPWPAGSRSRPASSSRPSASRRWP